VISQKELKAIQIEDWVVRFREPGGEGPHPVIMLLHGWTGDENAMWIFASRLPENHLLIAPRGPYKTPYKGYSWYPVKRGNIWPSLEDIKPAVDNLLNLMEVWPDSPAADFSQLRLAGFSQGAAMAYTTALLYPDRVISLAGLAGFMPEGASKHIHNHPLDGMPIFISHGKEDELVPIEKAREAVSLLERSGAKVTYCEHDVGHKLNAECFQGMEVFFASST